MWDPVPGCQWNVKVDGRKSPETRMKRQEAGKHLSSGKSFISFFFFGWLILRDEHFLPSYIYISGFLRKNWKKDPVIFVTIVGFDHCSWVFLKSIFFANMNFQKAWKQNMCIAPLGRWCCFLYWFQRNVVIFFMCKDVWIPSTSPLLLSSHPLGVDLKAKFPQGGARTLSAMHAILLRIEELKKQVRFVRIFFNM